MAWQQDQGTWFMPRLPDGSSGRQRLGQGLRWSDDLTAMGGQKPTWFVQCQKPFLQILMHVFRCIEHQTYKKIGFCKRNIDFVIFHKVSQGSP